MKRNKCRIQLKREIKRYMSEFRRAGKLLIRRAIGKYRYYFGSTYYLDVPSAPGFYSVQLQRIKLRRLHRRGYRVRLGIPQRIILEQIDEIEAEVLRKRLQSQKELQQFERYSEEILRFLAELWLLDRQGFSIDF